MPVLLCRIVHKPSKNGCLLMPTFDAQEPAIMQLPVLKFDLARLALQTLIAALVVVIGMVESDV
jgi:hypothetical protein